MRFRLAVLAMLLPTAALAQSPGTMARTITAGTLNTAMASKADATGGTLNAPSLNNALVSAWKNFDTVNIDPNNGQYNLLPGMPQPCHQVGQVYVLGHTCLQAQSSVPGESYAYSFGLANTDPGGSLPATGQPGASGSDKVAVYIGAEQHSNYSNLWGQNTVVTASSGATAGVAGYELDMNRFNPCPSKTDTSWIGDPTCSQFVGLWITGLNGGGTGGPAVFVTSAGGTNLGLFNDGVALAGGLTIRDTGFLDATNSNTVLKANATHTYGADFYNSNITSAAVRLMSGNWWGAANGQGIFWQPGPATNGQPGFSDSITDYGAGLTLTTGGNLNIAAAQNMIVSGAAIYLPNPAYQTGNAAGNAVQGATPFLQEKANGHLRVGQAGVTNGSLDVDGTVAAANVTTPVLTVTSYLSVPTVSGVPANNTPTFTGTATMALDTTDNKVCFNTTPGSTWKCAALQ